MCSSYAANRARLEAVVGRAEERKGVSRAKDRMRVIVNKACGDNDMVRGSGQMSRVCPNSPRRLGPSMRALSTRVQRH